jgi:hypothetical protein
MQESLLMISTLIEIGLIGAFAISGRLGELAWLVGGLIIDAGIALGALTLGIEGDE